MCPRCKIIAWIVPQLYYIRIFAICQLYFSISARKDLKMLKRIKKLLDEKHMNFSIVEKQLGFGNGTIRRWDKNYPSADKLLKLAELLNVSTDYLLTGNSSSITLSDNESNIIEGYRNLSPEEKLKIEYYIEVANTHKHTYITPIGYEATPIKKVAEESAKYGTKSIPVRGYVAAGKPIMAIDNHFDDIEVSNSKIDYALIVNGNSMNPLIKDGAYVYVQSCEQLENGEIGVFLINNDVTCKKFFQNDVMIKLISINPAYEDMVFMLNDPQNEHLNFKIEGRVIL